jgi:uncharacterized protein (TIGR02145 family)
MADTNGTVYKTTVIGEQIWMAENMASDTATDGSSITCYANTDADPDFVEHYGCLYNWEDAMKVCPKGWHLPTQTNFDGLLNIAGDNAQNKTDNLRSATWLNGNDSLGFNALPAGDKLSTNYLHFGTGARFWSATGNTTLAFYLGLGPNNAYMDRTGVEAAFSVRCIKD